MISLIVNEYKKIKASKIIISVCLIIVSIYILIYLNKDMSGIELFNLIYRFIPFLGILICVLFAGIVNNEVNKGTFRYYLTKPYYRSKVIISKLLFVYLYIVFIYFFQRLLINDWKYLIRRTFNIHLIAFIFESFS